MSLVDTLYRPLRDLRISVTDRCNFRCRYCMPAEIFGANYNYLAREEILNFDEIERLARIFVHLGVGKLRLTGGEPLMRRDLNLLVEKLASIDGVNDIAMTTNGSLLARNAEKLVDAGLHRVTVSIDALDDSIFGEMNGVGAKPDRVIEGIDTALAVGLGVKLNVVVKKGVNESELLPLAIFAYERKIAIRYIEFMDTGTTNGWKQDQVIPFDEILNLLRNHLSLTEVANPKLGETAKRYHIIDYPGFEVGFISSVTKPFCSDCNRLRLSAEGHLYTCLFAETGYDIKTPLRSDESTLQLISRISSLWMGRGDRYSELRTQGMAPKAKKEMSYLGG